MPRGWVNSGKLTGLEAAQKFFRGLLHGADLSRENLWVAHVDESGHCVHVSIHCGHETDVLIPLRSIVGEALQHRSAYLILAHNHPSGDPRPSESDRRATRQLAFVAEALGVPLRDHLIFGGSECSSFRKLGLL